jgi:hypothetical protein
MTEDLKLPLRSGWRRARQFDKGHRGIMSLECNRGVHERFKAVIHYFSIAGEKKGDRVSRCQDQVGQPWEVYISPSWRFERVASKNKKQPSLMQISERTF